MKKNLLIILSFIIVCLGLVYLVIQFCPTDNFNQKLNVHKLSKQKILIAYFSHTGNTANVARRIQHKVGGDLYRIELDIKNLEDVNKDVSDYTLRLSLANKKVEIKNIDISNYDVIFIGSPIWFGSIVPPIETFLADNDFEGKTIMPFATSSTGSKYNFPNEIKRLTKGAKVGRTFTYAFETKVLSPLHYKKNQQKLDNRLDRWLKSSDF